MRFWGLRRGITGFALVSAAVGATIAAAPTASADAPSNSPCDFAAALPFCTAALGPLRDVTADWRIYQPALVQPIPISDYFPSDPETADKPLGFGHCGTETTLAPPPAIPTSTEAVSAPAGVAPPPGKNSPYPGSRYCLLRYIPSDFDTLCASCHRILVDYTSIPSTGPGAEGHWAGRFTPGQVFQATIPVNAHSPNIKNLCSDKFFNPTPGSGCATLGLAFLDLHGLEMEGDTSYFHHFPLEGHYFNGPAYLAGDGSSVAYHWVQGAYFDIQPAGAMSIWYSAGYRGAGDILPDTDQSYGCLCDVPPLGHITFSASRDLSASVGAGTQSGTSALARGILGAASTPNTITAGPLPDPAPALPLIPAGILAGLLVRNRRDW